MGMILSFRDEFDGFSATLSNEGEDRAGPFVVHEVFDEDNPSRPDDEDLCDLKTRFTRFDEALAYLMGLIERESVPIINEF